MLTIIGGIIYFNGGINTLLNPQTVRAFGDLIVDFKVPTGTPLFNFNNLKPGDTKTKSVDVTNNGIVVRSVAVRGNRTGGTTTLPYIESALQITIKQGSTVLYGPKPLSTFFSDSLSTNGVQLNNISPNQKKTYDFTVLFPSAANDDYQNKSVVFDLTFGVTTSDHLVVNEVYYNVDEAHGLGKDKDKNDDERERTYSFKHQWVEIYNPTDKTISLKGWGIVNNSGLMTRVNSNTKIKPGGFAVLSKDASIWKYWNDRHDKNKIELGHILGNGLDVKGDHVYLIDPKGKLIDKLSWGNDKTGFSPPASLPIVPKGSSSERIAPGYNTDSISDWHTTKPPTPGY